MEHLDDFEALDRPGKHSFVNRGSDDLMSKELGKAADNAIKKIRASFGLSPDGHSDGEPAAKAKAKIKAPGEKKAA